MIRVLFFSANPVEGQDRLKLDEEYRDINDQIRKTKYGNQFYFQVGLATRVNDLQDRLQEFDANIVHFSGHGKSDSRLVLLDQDSHPMPVSAVAVAKLFELVNDRNTIRCVFLNACYSEEQAKAIANHVDCVIGMSNAVGDDAAKQFAVSFYSSLGYGSSIQKAFALACNSLSLEGIPEEDTPKLNVREGVDAAEVVLVKPTHGGVTTKKKSAPPKDTSDKREINSPPPEFQLIGTWRFQFNDGSTSIVEYYPNGSFMGQSMLLGMTHQVAGRWAYDSVSKALHIEGIVDGFRPLMNTLIFRDQKGVEYYGTGSFGESFVAIRG